MKTKETLYTTMCNNIGQVRIENAQKEIERLNRQYNTNSWRTDDSPFMFVEDETDDDVHNPCELIEGYVWVTCEPKEASTRQKALVWWNSIEPDWRVDYCIYHNDKLNLKGRTPSSLTGREIEEIWKNEVQIKELSNACHNAEYLKPNQKQFVPNFSTKEEKLEMVKEKFNQKQFKQFDESLHKAYLNKFSEEDKFKAFISNLNELSKEIQFNAFLATLKKMNLDSQTQSNIMALVALRDI